MALEWVLPLALLAGLFLLWRLFRDARPPQARPRTLDYVPMQQADRNAERRTSPWMGRGPSGLTMREWRDGRAVRTDRGDLVRSVPEARIANHLHAKGYRYEYEPEVCGFRPDFFLPEHGIVIEYWGSTEAKYDQRRRAKTAAYLRAGYALVSLQAGKDVPLERDLDRQLWHKLQAR